MSLAIRLLPITIVLGAIVLFARDSFGKLSSTVASTPTPLLASAVRDLLPPNPARLLPPFPSFNSQRLDQQIQLYTDYLFESGPPDVMIIGSSRALQGIDPEVLQAALVERGLPPIRVYNFSVNGATAQVVDLILRRILTPEQLPRLILWADGSRAFNSAKLDATYQGIAASVGYQELMRGKRPIPNVVPVASYWERSEFCRGVPLVLGLEEAATDSLEQFGQLLTVSDQADDDCPTSTGSSRLGDRPLSNPSSLRVQRQSSTDLNVYGFQSVHNQFDPATYYRQYPRVSGQYDSNYTPFQLQGQQANSTVAIASFARTQRLPLVFVSLPLHQHYLDPVRRTYEQQFRQFMQQLANREGFIFRDLSQQGSAENSYFADPSHLNHNGARAVARWLATDPAIPWAALFARDPNP